MDVIRAVLVTLSLLYGIGWTSTVVNWGIPHEIVRMSAGIYQSTGTTTQLTLNPYRGRATLTVAYDPAVLVKLGDRGKPVRLSPSSLRVGRVKVKSYGDAVVIHGPCSVRPYVSARGVMYSFDIIDTPGFSAYFNRSGYLVLVSHGRTTKIRVLPLMPLI
ncbi:hypothetical protein [Methanopyrus sp.]